MADQWLSWRLDCIAACLILIVAMLAISQRNNLSPSLTALSLTEVNMHACTIAVLAQGSPTIRCVFGRCLFGNSPALKQV